MKYGFIYLWRDRKHNRYYIGSHWGTIDDSYICSSKWMRDAYYYRPHDFKRRILSRVVERKDLLKEEQRWINMIKPEERKVRYYNLNLDVLNPWWDNTDTRKSVSEKIKKTHWSKGPNAEVIKEKLRVAGYKNKRKKQRSRGVGCYPRKPRIEKTCPTCSTLFKTPDQNKIYCNRKCYSINQKERVISNEQRQKIRNSTTGIPKPWLKGNQNWKGKTQST